MTLLSPLDDHLSAPRGRGALRDAPHQGAAGGAACGDLVRLAVRLGADGAVAEAGFDASGCGAAQAAASAAVELVEGAPLLEAARVGPDEIAAALGGLVPPKRHAAALAADALHRALGAAADAAPPAGGARRGRTLVAMSGGVDSAVAAKLLQDAGDEVVGVTLELWADPAGDGERSCCSAQAVTGARALAHRLGIPHLTLDLREDFRRAVVEDFVAEHAAGRTPNPCVRCNGLVRFDRMLALADRIGAERLATGHYARVERGQPASGTGPLLRAAADPHKDQAYMLARVGPETLGRVVFPLAELTKPEVRELARGAGLAVADKPDSQDLCFLAGTAREPFLERHAPASALPIAADAARGGEIVDLAGRVLARHDGQQRFTVGQRRGLGVAAGEPLFVVAKDAASGRVTVGPRAALARTTVAVEDARLHRPAAEVDRVKLRYRSEPVGCRVAEADAGSGDHPRLRLALARQVDAVAPGQTACLMRGDTVVGYATISGP